MSYMRDTRLRKKNATALYVYTLIHFETILNSLRYTTHIYRPIIENSIIIFEELSN